MNEDPQKMVVTKDQCAQEQQIKEGDHVRHNTNQFCGQICHNDHIVTLFLRLA